MLMCETPYCKGYYVYVITTKNVLRGDTIEIIEQKRNLCPECKIIHEGERTTRTIDIKKLAQNNKKWLQKNKSQV